MPLNFDIADTFICESTSTTLRDIIRLRVQQEVERFNRSEITVFRGLLQPEETERLLNGAGPAHRKLDWEKQYASALTAFGRNGFLVFVGEQQITELNERIE